MTDTVLNEGYGYGFVLGLGAAFALLMICVTQILKRYVGEVQNSEHFSTASRSVNTGLISSAVVSSWTWPGTLLTSAQMAYTYGVSGCMWYSFAFTVQITFFAVLALQIKKIAPGAHTVVEIVRARFDNSRAAHGVYLFYTFSTNIIISAMLLLGGSQAIATVTGMHVVAAGMLLPLGVWAYTVSGGLKSTFLSDWIHTVIVYIVILITAFVTYCGSKHIGSIDKMYDLLTEVAKTHPSGGHEGSYLTIANTNAVYAGWNIVIGGFATVMTDPGYSQKALAAKPLSALRGYFMGGICWLIIPWCLGSSAALACLALTNNPVSVTYPNMVPAQEVSEGIPMLYGMAALMGKPGAAAGILMIFMAATSATSAELIAFSSVATYDVFRTYIKPDATGKQLVTMSHLFVTIFALAMGGLAVMFNYIGITISWILTFIGIVVSPGVFGIVLTCFWSKMSKWGLIFGAPMATVSGIVCWIGATYHFADGVVDKNTLNTQKAEFIGNFVSLFSSLIYIVIISLIFPDNYDYDTMDSKFIAGDDATKQEADDMEVHDKAALERHMKIGQIVAWAVFIILAILVPLPMYGTNYIFSKAFFRGWIIVIMIWCLLAAIYITFYPIYESRNTLIYLFKVLTGKEQPRRAPEFVHPDVYDAEISHGSSEQDLDKKEH